MEQSAEQQINKWPAEFSDFFSSAAGAFKGVRL
jgi:hypothetical protein